MLVALAWVSCLGEAETQPLSLEQGPWLAGRVWGHGWGALGLEALL